MNKLTSEQLSDVVIESLALSVTLLERFETMDQNGLFTMRAKQSLRQTLPHIEAYVSKLITVTEEDEVEHFKKGATVITELSNRIERSLKAEHILDISTRKKYLKEMIELTALFPTQKEELYEGIRDSGILNY
jgi:NADPH-dependent curcumin reductase CurA